MTITNEMLRKQFAKTVEVSRQYTITQNRNTSTQVLDDRITTTVDVANIVKIQGNTVITEQGTKAELFNPMPCLFWKCMGTPDKNGVITLKNKLRGLFIKDNENTYCLGIDGASDEFEVRFQVGTNEIRINNSFININTQHLVINGVEEKQE